jgi:hypothetical protein
MQTKIVETASGTDKQVKALRFILAAKLFSAPYATSLDLRSIPITDETHKEIAAYIIEREQASERIRPSELFEILTEDCAELNAILDLNYDDKLTGKTAERFFKDSVLAVKKEALDKELALYNANYAAETDEEKKKMWAQKIVDCVKRRNANKG